MNICQVVGSKCYQIKKKKRKKEKQERGIESSRRGKAAILYVMSMSIFREDLSSSGNSKCKGPEAGGARLVQGTATMSVWLDQSE